MFMVENDKCFFLPICRRHTNSSHSSNSCLCLKSLEDEKVLKVLAYLGHSVTANFDATLFFAMIEKMFCNSAVYGPICPSFTRLITVLTRTNIHAK